MKISEIITDKYKLRMPPTVYYEILADVLETEDEQEHCEDAISRQAVIEAIEDDNRNGLYSCFASNNDAQCFKDVIRKLPSVNLQEPILDKIRTEIESALSDGMVHKKTVLGIIDKYKAESED